MRSQFELEMDALANGWLFRTKPAIKECPYCRKSFHPAWRQPKPDQIYGHWQKFCSRLCRKLWNEEARDE